jgi:hypothetical protein
MDCQQAQQPGWLMIAGSPEIGFQKKCLGFNWTLLINYDYTIIH